jgi:hypothetical protein
LAYVVVCFVFNYLVPDLIDIGGIAV